jgi:hypothetical protein
MIERQATLDRVVAWCEEQVRTSPVRHEAGVYDEAAREWRYDTGPNSVEHELRGVISRWHYSSYSEYSKGELVEVVRDWLWNGVHRPLGTQTREQLLDTLWTDVIVPWVTDYNEARGPGEPRATIGDLLACVELFTPATELAR